MSRTTHASPHPAGTTSITTPPRRPPSPVGPPRRAVCRGPGGGFVAAAPRLPCLLANIQWELRCALWCALRSALRDSNPRRAGCKPDRAERCANQGKRLTPGERNP